MYQTYLLIKSYEPMYACSSPRTDLQVEWMMTDVERGRGNGLNQDVYYNMHTILYT